MRRTIDEEDGYISVYHYTRNVRSDCYEVRIEDFQRNSNLYKCSERTHKECKQTNEKWR